MVFWLRRALTTMLLVAPALLPARAVDESDLLPVDQAFALTASAPAPGRIALRWKIAKGYALYRQRISVQADPAFQAQALQLPRGIPYRDPFFGTVETLRGSVQAILPGAPIGRPVTLQVKYQGCIDLGVCYPPQTRTLTVALPATALAAGVLPATPGVAAPAGDSGFDALRRSLSGGRTAAPALAGMDRQPLPPEQAFGFDAIVYDGTTLLLRFTPAKGYYLYRDKTTLQVSGADGIRAGQPRWPQGMQHRDPYFGNVIVYFDQVEVALPLLRTQPRAAAITLNATFQGCQADGICYPPMTRRVVLQLPAARPNAFGAAATAPSASAASVVANTAPAPASSGNATAAPALSEDSRLAAGLAGTGRWLTLLGFFAAGLLLAFTPCVLPMIPILSGLIAGQGARLGTRRALGLSLVYVLANALVFTMAGIVAGLLGANLQSAFQKPWVIAAFAALFVVLALSSFGWYQLQIPKALRARLGALTDRQRGGSLAGVAAMGALSSLIVGPCVAPPLAGAVLYIGQSRDPVFGGAALFLLAMGMGAPLLAFGAAAGRGLPASGRWMTTAQRMFGFVFLGLAVWMVSRILPASVTLALWGLLALAAAAWALTATPSTPTTRLSARFAGLLLAVVGAAQLFGALAGGSDPLQPLAGLGAARAPVPPLAFRPVESGADVDRALAAAQLAGKPLLLDFYADWCAACKEMARDTFGDRAVQAALADFVLVKADVTANDAADQALMQRFGVVGPPAALFFRDARERRNLRLIGFEKAPAFIDRVNRAR